MERRYRAVTVILAILTCFCLLVTVVGAFFAIADGVTEQAARRVPSYEKIDLTPLLQKEVWTDEDYETIRLQTGLSKSGADSVARSSLPVFQDAFFYAGEIDHEYVTPITPHDKLKDPETGADVLAPMIPLEEGWRHGHAALVVDGESGTVLESVAIGVASKTSYGGSIWFRKSPNFMVMRLKGVDRETRAKIAEDALERLTGLAYNVFVGFFLPKDQCKDGRTPTSTQCSHLVWQAFLNAGYDLDPTGGPLVTPDDIAASPLLEAVQVYGCGFEGAWK